MTRDVLTKLFEHMKWADALLFESLQAAEAPARSIELYAHVLGAENVWLTRLEGRPQEVAVWPELDRAGCAALAAANIRRYEAFLAGCNDAGFTAEVSYVNSAGQSFQSRVDDILLQVFTHGAYHRGQIAMLLRDAALEPAPTDYISFVRGVPAATRRK